MVSTTENVQWDELDIFPTPIFSPFIEVSDIWPSSWMKKWPFNSSQKNKAPSSLVVKLVIHSLDKYFNHHSAEYSNIRFSSLPSQSYFSILYK